jgi:hypothetical protein
MANRIAPHLFASTLFVAAASVLAAQDSTQYQGVSHPPADDQIITTSIPAAKPPAGTPMNAPQPAPQQTPASQTYAQPAAPPPGSQDPAQYQAAQGQYQPPAPNQYQPQPSSVDPSTNFPPVVADGTDDGIVRVAPSLPPADGAPDLNQRADQRAYAYDPDGDIVHPRALRSGELQEGTNIFVSLLDRLSTSETEKGEPFRTRVSSDVLQGGQVVIPAGAEIDGRVVTVSTGHAGGSGAMRLQPEAIILPDGTHYRLHAEVTGTPGSRTHVVGEGTIKPDSRAKRDGIEYGGAVGSGVVVGAIVAGPVGALTGGLIGAGAITVHLLVSHPQATLESGTTLIFQLTDPLLLAPETTSGN